MHKLIATIILVTTSLIGFSKTIYDTVNCNVQSLFSVEKALYVIRYSHAFCDTLVVPRNCELRFEGGSLSGPIVFNKSKLSGDVKLKGSSIYGDIINKVFDASWLCAMDGISDDAKSINEMIETCGKVFFPKGSYHLISRYNPGGKVPSNLQRSIKAHIGICKNDVELIGEDGSNFITDDTLGTICVFSKPYNISKSIENIRIKNIIFNVHNDGVLFHEFLHTIKTIGVNGLEIENCTFNDFWGDAICLSHYGDGKNTGERTRNQNIKILNNTIIGGEHHNNRNGISVISGENVIIRGNVIKNTSKKNMPGGIDIEPNNSVYTIKSIIIEKNTLEGIQGSGGAIGLIILRGSSAHYVEISQNRIMNCRTGITVIINTKNTTDNLVIKNNYVDKDTRPYYFSGQGLSTNWLISNNSFLRPTLRRIPGNIHVTNLIMKND